MSRANPFGDLDDLAPDPAPKPVPAAAIDRIADDLNLPLGAVLEQALAALEKLFS